MTAQRQSWMRIAMGFGFAGAVALAAPANAATDAVPAQAPAAAETRVAFAPPVDTPLRYEIRTSKTRGGKEQAAVSTQRLRFRRNGDGYILTVELVEGAIAGLPGISLKADNPKVPATLRPFLRPIDYDVSAHGELLRMREWDRVKGEMAPAFRGLAEIAEPDPAKRPAAAAMFDKVFAGFARLSPEEAAQLFLKPWGSFLGLGRTPRQLDQWYESQVQIPSGIFPTPIGAVTRIRLSHPDAATYRWEQESRMDPAKVQAAVGGYIESLLRSAPPGAAVGPEKIAEMRKALSSMTMVDRLTATIDAQNGLVSQARYAREMDVSGQKALDISEVKRLD